MDGPVPSDAFWGKLRRSPDGELIGWHPLADHCVDVAAVFQELLTLSRLRSSIEACLGQTLDSQQIARLAVLALLHDIGKCNTGFQWRRHASAPRVGHVLEVAGLFGLTELPAAFVQAIQEFSGWFTEGENSVRAMLLASISHHGRPVSDNDLSAQPGDPTRWWRPRDDLDPLQGVCVLLRIARDAFPEAWERSEPMPCPPALQHRFAGLVMLADWIGSDTRHFGYRESVADNRVWHSRISAGRALAEIGLVVAPSQADLAERSPSFAAVFSYPPYPLQRYLADGLSPDSGAQIVIAESDTGTGKTEAALAWFLRLFAAKKVDGLYFALPTQVAARELYGRVCRAVDTAFLDPVYRPSPVLLAVPGYAQADGVAASLPDPRDRLWADDPTDARRETVWAGEHPKRFLAAPVAVGTIDQALLSSLQVKHAHLRSVCLDRHLLVVDEVHASDPYMREVLAHLLEGHRARGGWALLLSATLGEAARTHLLREPIVPLEQARQRAYPLVSTLTTQHALPRARRRDKSVFIELSEDIGNPASLLPRVAEALRDGARVLMVLNTVSRANALMRTAESSSLIPSDALFSVAGVRCPHHGRFARADREIMDAAIASNLGPTSPDGPRLVIGTQTLEQSLDIDSDWLVTDPCPMDVLLQRLGRLHRHAGRQRPEGVSQARALMLAPTGGDFECFVTPNGQGRGPAGIGSVYADLRMLQRTVDVIRATPDVMIPADNRSLVEDALHPEALALLSAPAWQRHAQYLEGSLLMELRQAEIGRLNEQPFGECQFRANDERVVTRLGASDRRVRLPAPIRSPLGCDLTEVLIPGYLAPKALVEDAVDVAIEAEGFSFGLGERRYRYTRFGLERLDA